METPKTNLYRFALGFGYYAVGYTALFYPFKRDLRDLAGLLRSEHPRQPQGLDEIGEFLGEVAERITIYQLDEEAA